MNAKFSTVSLATLALFVTACSKDAPPPETPAEANTSTEEPTASADEKDDDGSSSDIVVSDEIKKACGLSDTEAHFAFASATVRDSDRAVLKKLAECFTTGPLKGRTMNLVGHADPRGEEEYNMVLGGRRADNVGSAIEGAGLPAEQVTTTSRGELDASGTDETSWAKDRRVDILLAEEQ